MKASLEHFESWKHQKCLFDTVRFTMAIITVQWDCLLRHFLSFGYLFSGTSFQDFIFPCMNLFMVPHPHNFLAHNGSFLWLPLFSTRSLLHAEAVRCHLCY